MCVWLRVFFCGPKITREFLQKKKEERNEINENKALKEEEEEEEDNSKLANATVFLFINF